MAYKHHPWGFLRAQSVSFQDLGDPPSGISYEVCCSSTSNIIAVLFMLYNP
jgi:hypothetical protein